MIAEIDVMNSDLLEEVAADSIAMARREIERFGVPDMLLLDISLEKGRWLSRMHDVSANLVDICVAMMDLKLGEAFKDKRISDHIAMSANSADTFLSERNVPNNIKDIVKNAIEAHHGDIPFKFLEAEICANADCYRFIHPKGVFLYLTVLGRRIDSFIGCIDQAEAKMDEKMAIVSLPLVRDELGPIYDNFKRYFAEARGRQ